MLRPFFTRFKGFDLILFIAVFLLMLFGLVTLYSINMSLQDSLFINVKKQLFFVFIGIILIFIFSKIDYRVYQNYNVIIYILAVLLLILVLLIGKNIKGTRGWFFIGGFGIQPVEFAKLALIIYLSKYLTQVSGFIASFSIFLKCFLIMAFLFFLVLLQPDLGSAMVLALIWLLMLLTSGLNKKYILSIICVGLIIAVMGWFFVLRDYQQARILAFIDPSNDPRGVGYNITQSIIATGAGQLIGRGIGFGSQSQLKFIPESQTDFIFAVIAEELGFLGVSLIFILYLIMLFRITKTIRVSKENFGAYLSLGILLYFVIHIVINIGMTIGLMPIAGIPLPFLSYGGSFMIMNCIMLGIIQSVNIINARVT
jgi:rod shape determining protein RodA